MDCSPWGGKESGTTERLTLTLTNSKEGRGKHRHPGRKMEAEDGNDAVSGQETPRIPGSTSCCERWGSRVPCCLLDLRLLVFRTERELIPFISPGGSNGKESACNAGDLGSIPGSGRSPREGNGNPLQHSCLKNSMDRGAWQTKSMGSQRGGHG